jgi:ATP:ADP antiporter, AAA family
MTQRFHRFLPEPRELHKALWLGTVLLSITSSYTLVKIARDALFLSRLPAQSLPFVYLMVGVLTLAVTWVFGRLTYRFSPLKTLASSTAVAAAVLVAFAFAFQTRLSWMPMAFYVWVNVYGLILTSQFWVFTNSVSDPREAKRIFGIIGGGGILGGLVAGLVAARFGNTVSLEWLALAGAALLAAMVVALLLAVRGGSVERTDEPPAESEAPPSIVRVPYVRWLALATFCSVVVTGLIDYQFKVVVQAIHPDAPGLASFFGRFFIAVNVAALLLQLLGTRWLLHRFGAVPAAAVMPIGLAVGAAATLVAPGFRSVMFTRLWDQMLRFSLNKSTTELFYFPMDPGVRRRAKAFIEAGIERFGDAIAGLLILGAAWFLDTRPITLSGIVLVLICFWLIAWLALRGGYVRELGRTLRRMNQGLLHETVSLRERNVLKELVRALDSRYERVVLQALEMLEEVAPTLIEPRLPRLLEHPSAAVKAKALELAGRNPTAQAREAVSELLQDPDPMVRLKALCARGAMDPAALAALDGFVESPEPELRAMALACLVQHAPDTDLPRLRGLLESRLRSSSSADRLAAAEALGARRYMATLHDLLPPCLEDPEVTVRSAALRSMGRAQWRDQVPTLIKAFGAVETEAAARAGLLAFGPSVATLLGDAIGDPRTPIEVRRAIPPVLREIPTVEAVAALFRVRDRSDPQLGYRVLKAANRIRLLNRELEFPAEQVSQDLDQDVRDFLLAEIHVGAQGEPADEADRFLVRVLRERRDQAFNRAFRRLALLYPPNSMFAAYHGVLSSNSRVRGSAVEYVESSLSAEHRALIDPLLSDAPVEERIQLTATRFGLAPLNRDASMAALLESEDAWLRTAALYVVGRHRERQMLARVEASLQATDAWVRETAGWARVELLGARA